jgi:hypothetical protein
MDRRATFKQEETSGHEPQLGLDTKIDRLTNTEELKCDLKILFMCNIWSDSKR